MWRAGLGPDYGLSAPAFWPGSPGERLGASPACVWPVQMEFAAVRMTFRTKPGWDSMGTWLLSTS